jgi:peptidoglycan DL-endopeptidase CwlO
VRQVIGGLTRRLAVLVATLSVAALAATAAFAEPVSTPEIEAERERAQGVLAEIAAIDAELELAVDAYNGATYELSRIEAEIEENQRHLKIAKRAYRIAQENLEERIVTLYENGEQDVLEVILGATSLDDLLDRVDSVKRISSQDVEIIQGVTRAKADIREREKKLERARKRQGEVVADRAAARDAIESQLAEREDLYASIEDQIAELEAEERERQRRAAEEARRREEEQRALAAAAAAAGVDQSVVAQIAAVSPEGIGTAPPSQRGAQAVAVAMQYLGVPYVWGGMSPSGFDCSGLVAYSYAQIGISLPHHAASMYGYGVPVSYDELAPGDLVFANGLGHMGMYIGGGNYIHAPHTGDVVRIASMSSRSDWIGFKRVA